ncbi:hypothetical protein RFI_18107, partial [Reticulomyxa filosa]
MAKNLAVDDQNDAPESIDFSTAAIEFQNLIATEKKHQKMYVWELRKGCEMIDFAKKKKKNSQKKEKEEENESKGKKRNEKAKKSAVATTETETETKVVPPPKRRRLNTWIEGSELFHYTADNVKRTESKAAPKAKNDKDKETITTAAIDTSATNINDTNGNDN